MSQILERGTPDEQMQAIDALASVDCRPVRLVLIEIMTDTFAALDVRDRATEMLNVQHSWETVEACARSLRDSQPSIRFWAAYTLGQVCVFHRGLRAAAASALAEVLDDTGIALGWWSVGREAQAICGLRDIPGEREAFQAEVQRVQQDPNSSAEDRRWADCYSD